MSITLFYLTGAHLNWEPALPAAITALAIAQIGFTLGFFLHITTSPDNENTVHALAFGMLIVTLSSVARSGLCIIWTETCCHREVSRRFEIWVENVHHAHLKNRDRGLHCGEIGILQEFWALGACLVDTTLAGTADQMSGTAILWERSGSAAQGLAAGTQLMPTRALARAPSWGLALYAYRSNQKEVTPPRLAGGMGQRPQRSARVVYEVGPYFGKGGSARGSISAHPLWRCRLGSTWMKAQGFGGLPRGS